MWLACLGIGPPVALARRSAALVWGLAGVAQPARVEVAVPTGREFRPIPGLRVRRVVRLDVVIRHRLPVTSLPATVLELAAVLPEAELGDLTQELIRRRVVDPTDLHSELRRGRPGSAALRRVLGDVTDGAESIWERRCALLLARSGLPRPRHQHRLTGPDGSVAYLDLAYPAARLAIEVDGFVAHSSPQAFRRDRERQNLLVSLGWTVLRYSVPVIRESPDVVVRDVRRHLCSGGSARAL